MTALDNTTPHSAAEYDASIRKTVPFYDCFYTETIDLVAVAKPAVKVWLDTGCGTGAMVARALRCFPATLFLLADPSRSMLAQAARALQDEPASRIQVVGACGSEDLPSDLEQRPEVITAVQSHHYLTAQQRAKATRKCFDLLEDNGIYITFENVRPDSADGVELGLKRWMAYQAAQGRPADVVKSHGERFNKAYFPITLDEHFRLLRQCGFRVAELLWFSHMQAGFYAIK